MTLYTPKPPVEKSFAQRISMVFIVILTVSVITLVYLIGLKQPESSTQDGAIEFAQATQIYTPGQDMTIQVSNVVVFVPKNATTLEGRFSVIKRESNLLSATGGSEWHRPLVINIEYLNSGGIPYREVDFASPVQICFKLTNEQWRDYNKRPQDYLVQFFAEDQNPPRWENLVMVSDTEKFQLCGLTNHLSLFALAIWSEEAIPVTGLTATPGLAPYAP
jgi:hypothetical protein